MKKDNVFWGLLLVLAGIYIIINHLGFMPDVNIMKLVVAVVCAVVFVKSVIRVEFGGMLFSLAILVILFDGELGLTAITPWPVLVAALLGSIGLDMIFGGQVRETKRKRKKDKAAGIGVDFVNGDEVLIQGWFNGYKKNISSDNFTKARISCKFCGMEISFDDAVIQGGTAVVDLDVSFSGVECYVPHSWKIENHTNCMFGGFDEHQGKESGVDGPTLVFEGNVRFGGVDIYRI